MIRLIAVAIAVALAVRGDTTAVVVIPIVVQPAPPMVVAPTFEPVTAAPVPKVAEPACGAPFTASSSDVLDAPRGIQAITVSRHDVRLLAAWSADALYVSIDEGATFTRVLDRPGAIGDAAFDCRGRLHVIRGDGRLGTYDPKTGAERWVRAATFWSSEADVDLGRLVPDGAGVAVLGNTKTRRDRLWLSRRDAAGDWRARSLFSDREPGYWSGIEIGPIEVLAGDRLRASVMPNMAAYGTAECGYAKTFELTFEVGKPGVAVRDHGEGSPTRDDRVQHDLAGRWLVIRDERVVRYSSSELAARLAE